MIVFRDSARGKNLGGVKQKMPTECFAILDRSCPNKFWDEDVNSIKSILLLFTSLTFVFGGKTESYIGVNKNSVS